MQPVPPSATIVWSSFRSEALQAVGGQCPQPVHGSLTGEHSVQDIDRVAVRPGHVDRVPSVHLQINEPGRHQMVGRAGGRAWLDAGDDPVLDGQLRRSVHGVTVEERRGCDLH
jgi:hypothetical protein